MDNSSGHRSAANTIAVVATAIELSELVAAGMLSVVVQGTGTSVSSVHFYGETERPPQGCLIAAAGATDFEQQENAVALAGASGASVVVVRQLAATATSDRCGELGVTLAELGPQVGWSHLVWLVRSLMDRAEVVVGPESAAQQGLFAMADAFAAMLGAPVTIEDAHSRVVAYSATTDGADSTRTSTIMSRAVPAEVLRRLRATGVLKRLVRDVRPFIVPAMEPGFLQRLVIPLRVGGQTVGSIWAIWDGRLDPQLEAQLTATASAAAMSLVQLNASIDLAGRYSIESTRAALRGDCDAATSGWGMPFHRCRVVALQSLSASTGYDDVSLWRSYFRKKSWPDPILADVDGVTFAVVPDRPGPGGWAWLADLARTSAPAPMAASRPISGSHGLPSARQEAAEALGAVCALGHPVGAYEEVWDTVALRRAAAAVASIDHDELRRLYDAQSGAQPLASTLRVWLECASDIRETASILHLHPNTVRHRMKKIEQLVGSCLQSRSQRLATLLLLRGWDEVPPT